MNKVVTYIDGFNLYNGLCDAGLQKYLWLNVQHLAQSLLRFNQELVMTKYFTAPVINNKRKEEQQTTYLEALETLNYLEIFRGHFLPEPEKCPKCQHGYYIPKEKMTDVNIAVQMLLDAYDNRFNTALLITADTDLVPVIEAIKSRYSDKRIIVCFPPKRISDHLKDVAHGYIHINNGHLGKSLFPPKVTRGDGYPLTKPSAWP